MPTTDQQVDDKRREVEQLREDIASTVAEISRKQRELDNDRVMTGLEAEEERLLAELETHQTQLEALGGATPTPPATESTLTPMQAPAVTTKSADKPADTSTNGKG